MMVGEEGGEESPVERPRRPGRDDVATRAGGEEGGEAEEERPEMTTMALGEEGGEAAS